MKFEYNIITGLFYYFEPVRESRKEKRMKLSKKKYKR